MMPSHLQSFELQTVASCAQEVSVMDDCRSHSQQTEAVAMLPDKE
jgi:hypothetical protein